MYKPILFITLLLHTTSASCPDEPGWFEAGDFCYLASLDKMSWYHAQEVRLGLKNEQQKILDMSIFYSSFAGVTEPVWLK